MSAGAGVKEQVRQFYDSVGWQQIGDGLYQNARYEDLRPVSRAYLQRCHLRVVRFLPEQGKYLLDAGSGPIQYPEYLEYSKGYGHRVCLDISRQALGEARKRIGEHGLYVVGDVAHLPFQDEAFDGIVSLHTIHHLPPEEHETAFRHLYRTLRPGGRSVVVYSWGDGSPLMRAFAPSIQAAFGILRLYRRVRGRSSAVSDALQHPTANAEALLSAPGTYTFKHDYVWFRRRLGDLPGFEIRVWRSVSTSFLRAFIHRQLLGGLWLRWLYTLEEWFPRLMGRLGQYPMILFGQEGGLGGEGSGEGRGDRA